VDVWIDDARHDEQSRGVDGPFGVGKGSFVPDSGDLAVLDGHVGVENVLRRYQSPVSDD
jgi:hypothetical protein